MRPWHRLSGEAMDAPSLRSFKTRLDGTLGNPTCGKKLELFDR